MSSNKTIKLLVKRSKNRPEMKAFLFNILETIADNFSAQIEFTPIWKTKVLSYHLLLNIANISWERVVTIRPL